ncbi:hypothetical protein ACFLY4_10475 [Chloroflexota bacterium]
MKTKQQIIKQIMALSFLILLMMGLLGCGSMEVGALPADDASANDGETEEVQVKGIEIGIEPTPMPETLTYTNDFYGFKFDYPETWTKSEIDHGVVLKKGTNRLGINFRWINENIQPRRTGMGGDSLVYSDKISFMGQIVPGYIVELDHLAKAYLLGDTSRIEIDDLAFAIIFEDLEMDYMTLDLPEEIIAEAITIMETFEQIEATGIPPEDVSLPEPNGSPPATTTVVAWLGHIASLPEGSQFDDMVMLSPEGTGEFGLTGASPEIEAEIHSLRDAEGPNEYVHFWGTLVCDIDDYNNCQLIVDRLQYGANFSEEDISDWFGTIKSSTFNDGQSYVFELLNYFPMWYSIHASQNETLQAQIERFLKNGEIVEVSGKLMVGVPDVNGTRIEISSIEVRTESGMPRPDYHDESVYENREYGFAFSYPPYMSVVEEPNKVLVNNSTLQLMIAYRRADENTQITDLGGFHGTFNPYYDIQFLGQPVKPSLNILSGSIAGVYLGGYGVELGEETPLRFVVSLVKTDGTMISNARVDEMLQIFQSFGLASWSD